MTEVQLEFEFVKYMKCCTNCLYCVIEDVEVGTYWTCQLGLHKPFKQVGRLPSICNSWKKGRSKMSFVDFKKLTEEQLRAELERIRGERAGVGRKRRTESKERRIKDGNSEKSKQAENNAEWV